MDAPVRTKKPLIPSNTQNHILVESFVVGCAVLIAPMATAAVIASIVAYRTSLVPGANPAFAGIAAFSCLWFIGCIVVIKWLQGIERFNASNHREFDER